MKVLFAVNNESISESIIKKYQQEYKEIITSKNVYYFDAITRELQKDKTYDRIVISEDVEPFANNNYGVIDKFIFERLDSISDEATGNNGQDIPIILICADRRSKSENILVKIFGIGIYNALLGQDRTISNVCELMNKPRSKKEAKVYYRIEADDVEYKSEAEGDVNEVEIQNILNHYKKLGKNEDEYVRSFDNIAGQYTDAQLRVICKFLPLNVKAVLEESSPKYQELITFGTVTPSSMQTGKKIKHPKYVPNEDYYKSKNSKNNIQDVKKDITTKNIGESELTKPVIIPTIAGVKKKEKQTLTNESDKNKTNTVEVKKNKEVEEKKNNSLNTNEIEDILQSVEIDISDTTDSSNDSKKVEQVEEAPKKRRGRPKKIKTQEEIEAENKPKRGRGRPKKVQVVEKVEEPEEDEEAVDLFGLGEEEEKQEDNNGELILPGLDEENDDSNENELVLPGLDDDTDDNKEDEETVDLFGLGSDEEDSNTSSSNSDINNISNQNNNQINNNYSNVGFDTYSSNNDISANEIEKTRNNNYGDENLKNLISMTNKLVAFVGTSKNGTSFIVNSIAEILSKKGIKTAILDLTQNKNSYYIYTQNDEELRKIAYTCIDGLNNGVTQGIEVSKNLTVYTTLPDRHDEFNSFENILKTLMQNYSLVLMDCDYETNYAYFNLAKEIYLVQSFDILTIQPLTAFLRNLKSRNILDPNKLRVVLNKVLRVRSISERVIIGGMSSYNDPSMSYMTELFDKDNIQYCSIPFDQEAYSRYLDGLVNCEVSTKGYPKNIMAALEKLGNMIYPLLNNDKPANKFNAYNTNTSNFSNDMNETLNKMKNRY
jgi:hypothetical protein